MRVSACVSEGIGTCFTNIVNKPGMYEEAFHAEKPTYACRSCVVVRECLKDFRISPGKKGIIAILKHKRFLSRM
jgi:hypothetical protein